MSNGFNTCPQCMGQKILMGFGGLRESCTTCYGKGVISIVPKESRVFPNDGSMQDEHLELHNPVNIEIPVKVKRKYTRRK